MNHRTNRRHLIKDKYIIETMKVNVPYGSTCSLINTKVKLRGATWWTLEFGTYEEFKCFLALNNIKLKDLTPEELEVIEFTMLGIEVVILNKTPTEDYLYVIDNYIEPHKKGYKRYVNNR